MTTPDPQEQIRLAQLRRLVETARPEQLRRLMEDIRKAATDDGRAA
ncbi:hypothetical protein [Rhodosalinus halophilus]|jgi:hypothetical protein|nr:hypothetical protein [Rhodosalinus halophilus]